LNRTRPWTQAPGLIPIRAQGDGLIPVPGWTDEYEWTGYIPSEELPRVYNPPKGYIVSANNPVVPSTYPHKLALDYDHGYRARRIEDMIVQRRGTISIEDIEAMQGDDLNNSALQMLRYLGPLDFEDDEVIAARDILLNWDGRMDMDSAGAALYAYFWVALVEEIFGDQIPERLWSRDSALAGGSRLLSCVNNLLGEPDNRWWDDVTTLDKTETRDDILTRSFVGAFENGTEEFGPQLHEWRWGDIHTATFQNQTLGKSGIGLVEKIFNRGPVSTAGGFHQVNRSDFSIDEPFEVYHLSAMRQIIDLKDLSKSLMIHTTGQSGHPKHRHYDDFIDPWRFTEYHPTHWKRDDVEKTSDNRLLLKPL
jgi:penicillin amidase